MTGSRPTVSVITPAHNAERFLREALASMQSQTLENWEQVIVDDGSSDRTVEIVDEFAQKDPRFRLVRHDTNQGVVAARNTSLRQARGRYLAFLDADDYWLPRKLERQVGFMQRRGYAFSYHQYLCIDEDGEVLSPKPVWMPASANYEEYLGLCGTIGNISVMLDRDQTGPIQIKNVPAEDFLLFLKLLKRFRAHGLFEDLARYRVVHDSLSSRKLTVLGWIWNIYRNEEQLGLARSARYMSAYIYRGITKKLVHKRSQQRG